jgi:flavin reductase (DIM6/NTAB) family NADH-FMN oxidoreductase RutF
VRIVDLAELAPRRRHEVFHRLVAPHSVAVISTADPDGTPVIGPLGYCVPLGGRQAVVGITIAAVRDAGGEPARVRAAAMAGGEIVANLTTTDLGRHLADLSRAPRDRATGLIQWPTVASHRVAVPSVASGRIRLECRVLDRPTRAASGGAELAMRDRDVAATPGGGYVVMAEVVCVVADEDLLDAVVSEPVLAGRQNRAEFPWFFGPADGTVVDGTVIDGTAIDRTQG